MLTAPYKSTGNFRLPIPVSDWLIFYRGDLIFHQKEKNENNKNTNFMIKKNKKGQKAFLILNSPH